MSTPKTQNQCAFCGRKRSRRTDLRLVVDPVDSCWIIERRRIEVEDAANLYQLDLVFDADIRERDTTICRFLIDAHRSVALSATFVVILIAGLYHAIVESWTLRRKERRRFGVEDVLIRIYTLLVSFALRIWFWARKVPIAFEHSNQHELCCPRSSPWWYWSSA